MVRDYEIIDPPAERVDYPSHQRVDPSVAASHGAALPLSFSHQLVLETVEGCEDYHTKRPLFFFEQVQEDAHPSLLSRQDPAGQAVGLPLEACAHGSVDLVVGGFQFVK